MITGNKGIFVDEKQNHIDKIKNTGTATVSDRLRFLMDNLGIKQVHLANKLGVTPQAIHQLCSGKQQFSKHTSQIAKILNANEAWLQTGAGEPFIQDKFNATSIREFAVYRLSQLDSIKNVRARATSLIPQEKYVTLRQYHANSIGFYIENAILAPKFESNDIVLVEPINRENLKDGDLILIFSQELRATVFCYLRKIKNEQLIGWMPGNENAAPTFFTVQEDDLIYGLYRECLKTA